MTVTRRTILAAAAGIFCAPAAFGQQLNPKDWAAVLAAAKGQTVYWNAWAGEPRIND
jgi:putative thiamine transport system substrate-binding protein